MIDLLYITIAIGLLIIGCIVVNIVLCVLVLNELRDFISSYNTNRFIDRARKNKAMTSYITNLQEEWRIDSN